MRFWPLLAGILLAAPVLTGCGDGRPPRAPVMGRVTVGGQPLTSGRIHFWPADGVPAHGEIGPDGRYRLTTFAPGDGAVPGGHEVCIEATRIEDAGPTITSFEQEVEYYRNPAHSSGGRPTVHWLVPERYSQRQTTDLTAEVKPGKTNEVNFDLPTPKPGEVSNP